MPAPIDRRLLQRAAATRKFLVAVVLTGVTTAFLVIAQAWLIGQAVGDTFYRNRNNIPGVIPQLALAAGLLILVFIGRGLMTWLNSWLGHRASAEVKSQLRQDLMQAKLKRPADKSMSSGTLVGLITSQLDDLDGYYAKFLPQLVMAVVVPVIILVPVFIVDWQSGVIAVLTVPLIPLFMALIGYRTKDAVAKRFKAQNRLANHFADLVAGLETLQVFGRARAQVKGLEKSEAGNRKTTMGTLRIAFLSAGVLELLATLSVALIAVTIGFRAAFGMIDLNQALFVLVLAPEIYLPIRQVGTHFHDSANGLAASKAAFDYIDEAEEKSAQGSLPAPDLGSASIVFDHVSLHYPGAKEDSLTDLSMQINPGEVIALAGRSGGGKTSALMLLMGFEKPTSGLIKVGDLDLSEIDLDSWRSQLAYVAQEPGMVTGTIADNIRIGYPGATDDQLRSALDRAGGQKLALDRPIGDDAEGLSAGERRRVAVARALLRIELGKAKLLVLDEPTAGLDQQTEAQVVHAVRESGVGAVVVSHRQVLLDMADQVIEIEGIRA